MHTHGQLTHVAHVHQRIVGVVARVAQRYVQDAHGLGVVRVVVLDDLVTERLERVAVVRVDDAIGLAEMETPHDVGRVVDAFEEGAADRECRVDGRVVKRRDVGRAFKEWT